VTHWTERAAHQGRAAHQAVIHSVKLHARSALGEARGALGFKPKICWKMREFTSSPHKFAGRLTSTSCAWLLEDKCDGFMICLP